MSASDVRAAWVAWAHCAEPADPAVARLCRRWGPVEALDRLRSGTSGLSHGPALQLRLAASAAAAGGPAAADERAHAVGARIVTRADREWPGQLADLGDRAPFAMWVCGAADLRLLALRSVAIVGARACTGYGQEVAREWAAALAGLQWCVLSGGAFGIDAAAHRGALAGGGTTVCVLAGGVDVAYPRAHEALLARIADEGLLASESPPGEPVRRQRFLSRNRLIAALTRATVVVEAAERSGTIATARSAHAMNRPVLAVPGQVHSPASAGCHRMIQDREAVLARCPADVVAALDLAQAGGLLPPNAVVPSGLDLLTAAERRVLDALPARGSIGPGALVAAAGLPAGSVWAALALLEEGGWVRPDADGWRLARLPGQRAAD